MIEMSPSVTMPALQQTPVQAQFGPMSRSMRGTTARRIDSLRCLLWQRDLKTRSQDSSSPTPPVLLGQWRN
jgi:hypothetical protein